MAFLQISSTSRIPRVVSEFDPSRAVNALQVQTQILLIGQKLASGTQAAEAQFSVQSLDAARAAAGTGSHFADQVESLLQNNSEIRVTGILLDDDGGGVAATKTATFSGTATEAGTINTFVANRRVTTAVAIGDAAATVATNVAASLTSNSNLIMSAAAATAVVTVTAKNKGQWTEKIPFAVNPKEDQVTPAGLSVVVADSVTGVTNPDLALAIAVMTDDTFDYIGQPYNDDTNLDLFEIELFRRQDAENAFEGHSVNAFRGTFSAAGTYGDDRNNQHSTTMGIGSSSLSAEHQWSSAYLGQSSKASSADPAAPWTRLPLIGIDGGNEFIKSERNSLLFNGVASFILDPSGKPIIERGITNYQKNSIGDPDVTFLDSMTPLTLSFFRKSFNQKFSTLYQGYKLISDGGNISAGEKVTSPELIRGEVIGLASLWVELHLMEDIEQFKRDLIVERNLTDLTRVDIQMRPNVVNQLYVIANLIQFIL